MLELWIEEVDAWSCTVCDADGNIVGMAHVVPGVTLDWVYEAAEGGRAFGCDALDAVENFYWGDVPIQVHECGFIEPAAVEGFRREN